MASISETPRVPAPKTRIATGVEMFREPLPLDVEKLAGRAAILELMHSYASGHEAEPASDRLKLPAKK